MTSRPFPTHRSVLRLVGLLLLAWAVVVMHAGVAHAAVGHGPLSGAMSMSTSADAPGAAQPGCVHPEPDSPLGPHAAMMADSCLTTAVVTAIDHTPTQALATVCFVASRCPTLTYRVGDVRTSRPPQERDLLTELGVNRT